MATSLPTRLNHVASVRGLTRVFGERTVIDGLDIDLERGEFVALLGRSGSGKSTLLRALAGLDPEATGALTVDGTVAVAFQEPRLLPWKRVIDNVALGLNRPKEAAYAALEEVGLPAWRRRGRSRCPAGRRSAPRWRGPSSANPTCCCSTSRSARSTH
ncbi:hypothetical protein GCM10029978_022810 [Actinoallomurus acanthiterrae]